MSVNPERLTLLIDYLRLSLLERKRAKSLKLDTDTSDAHLRRNLDTLHQGIEELEKEQTRLEEHGEVSTKELREREDVLIRLRSQYDELLAEHESYDDEEANNTPAPKNVARDNTPSPYSDNPKLSMDRTRGLNDYDEEAARHALMGSREVPSALRKSKTVRFTDNAEDGESEPVDNTQMLQLHQRIMDDQDQSLDQLSQSISRQRELSMQIGDELESQVELLDDVDGLVDRTQGSLNGARKRMNTITRKAKDNGSLITIAILIIVLVLLIIITK